MKEQQYINVFEVKDNIACYGVWYALWFHGTSPYALWTIFVASRILKRENADWRYAQH